MKSIGHVWRFALTASLVILPFAAPGAASGQAPKPAVGLEPVAAILNAFETHNIVALSEPHLNVEAHALRMAIVRHPRFPTVADDIVWECGNARFQDVMDRFVRGENVPDGVLRQAWQQTVGSIGPTCDVPIYEEFIRTVRDVNNKLPRAEQLRILLGDPPIDWGVIRGPEDAVKWAEQRDTHAVDVIRREVVEKKRRALVIYGSGHLARKSIRSNYERDDLGTLVDLLGDVAGASIFSIWSDVTVDLATVQPDLASWDAPKLAMLRGTILGAWDYMDYYVSAGGRRNRFNIRGGKRAEIPETEWRSRRMEDQFDAALYLGPRSAMTTSRLPAALCADPAYMQMRLGRMTMIGQPTDGLKKYCASVAPQ